MASVRRCLIYRVFRLILYILLFSVLSYNWVTVTAHARVRIPKNEVNHWAVRFGYHIIEITRYMTLLEEMKKGFTRKDINIRVVKKNGSAMVAEMSKDIETMMAWKIQALQRIADTAEQAKIGHVFDPNLDYQYINAKEINSGEGHINLPLIKDRHFFGIPVDITNSSVHVPTNVYEKGAEVVNAISWSERLNPTFQCNYHLDPSLNWQYFGSSTGFLRQFPAMKWTSQTVDTYDCRMRPWYIEAATSPKDMIILLDGSGSMTGLKKEIAKHVALNILDTLNDDDRFIIYRFSANVTNIVPDFNNSLVPANMENIRVYKKNLQNIETSDIANFSLALGKSFELLLQFKESIKEDVCNQAIMLITDGAPHTYDELIGLYNHPQKLVRIFTYLIGQEMADEHNVLMMACTNRGYYSHVSTLAEARDQVQHYVSVMARPLVLHNNHRAIWTSVYADLADPKMSDWLWKKIDKERQKEALRLDIERLHADWFGTNHDDSEYISDDNEDMDYQSDEALPRKTLKRKTRSDHEMVNDEEEDAPYSYSLMTTVAYPVFDQTNDSNRIGHLLGVAGTDVPIEEITKLAPAYKLGVNAYAFAVTNNGYVLFHPDLRPFQHLLDRHQLHVILKPDYNSVDLAEVELPLDDPTDKKCENIYNQKSNVERLHSLRKAMIDRKTGNESMCVKVHLDNMKRVVTRSNTYHYAPLNDTPFSFGIALPFDYGQYELKGRISLKPLAINYLDYKQKVLSLFEGNNWQIHPDWVYCHFKYNDPDRPDYSNEENFKYFLNKVQQDNKRSPWKPQERVKPLLKQGEHTSSKTSETNKNEHYCDVELVESVVFDADATKKFGHGVRSEPRSPLLIMLEVKNRQEMADTYGITLAFVSTRSGLTRWDEFELGSKEFITKHNRAIDETWYKRAVDYRYVNNEAFVFSVPFHGHYDSTDNDLRVTGSHAIFVEMAPAAVIGLQFKHFNFSKTFLEMTSECSNKNCSYHCGMEELNCYLLDDNGFVVVSVKEHMNLTTIKETGRFFGDIDKNVMKALVSDEIYKRFNIVDYQAVCYEPAKISDSCDILRTPFVYFRNSLMYIWSKLVFFYFNYNLFNWWNGDFGYVDAGAEHEYDHAIRVPTPLIIKNDIKPCIQEFGLYQLQPKKFSKDEPIAGEMQGCHQNFTWPCNKSFVVQLVPRTNLLFVAVDASCSCDPGDDKIEMKDIHECSKCKEVNLVGSSIHDYRRRPEHCTYFHPQELEIEGHCGSAIKVNAPLFLVVSLSIARWFVCHPIISS